MEGFHEFNESRNLVEEPILVNRLIRLSELKHVKWKYIKLESRKKLYFIPINIKLTEEPLNSIENGGKIIFCLFLKLEVALLHNRTLVIKLVLHRHLALLTTSTQPIFQQILRRQGCLVCLLCVLVSHNGEKHL